MVILSWDTADKGGWRRLQVAVRPLLACKCVFILKIICHFIDDINVTMLT